MSTSTSSTQPPNSKPLPRLPVPSDFPSSLTLTITPPPANQKPINILILLHGLGDTEASFTTLGKNLNLPETACISVRGPNPIPPFFTGSERPAFHWGDDVLFDEGRGEVELDCGFKTSTRILTQIIQDVLIKTCNYPPHSIHLLGYGQGGMAAVSFASSPSPSNTPTTLGSIISIGGALPSSSTSSNLKNKTPVLICGASRSTQVTKQSLERTKKVFENVKYVRWEKREDGMPGSREEMLPVMQFLAVRLRSMAGVPEGSVEV